MRILVAGGGTGGHFFPAVAVIDNLLEEGHEVLYLGTKNGIEFEKSSLINCDKVFFDLKGVRGKGIIGSTKGVFSVLKGISSVKAVVERFLPDKILLFGGYVSFPAGIVGYLKKISVYIHEQNSIPGKTNKILKRFAKGTFLGNNYCLKFFEDGVFTGNPLRKEFIASFALSKNEARKKLSLTEDKFTILVVGGSQGALFINEIMKSSAHYLASLRKHIQIIHITGTGKDGGIKETYESAGLDALTVPFTDTPWLYYRACDMAISRSGALAVAELTLFGIPTVFIPYPYAADDHQFYNVVDIYESGGCFLVRQENLTSEILKDMVFELFENKRKREKFSSVMAAFAVREATDNVVRELENG